MKPTKKWYRTLIPIKDLSLWDENARFPEEYFSKTEADLIDYFLKKKELKIDDFAKEVVAEFDLPQLEKLVVLDLNGRLIVLEGNRRLTVYKLLINPALAKKPEVRKFFNELQKKITLDENFKLEANLTPIREEGLRYVDRKHNKGNNEVGWGEPERRNFAIRRAHGSYKDVLRVDLSNFVKKLKLQPEIKNTVLGKGFVTNFYRIVDSAAAQEKLGYTVMDDGKIEIKDQKEFDKLLKTIVYNVWNKKSFDNKPIDSRSLNKKGDIDRYLKSLDPKDADKVDKEIKKRTAKNLFGAETIMPAGERSRPISTIRKYLITSSIYIHDNRINDIYNELRNKLLVDEVPNATAVLFRVFLECSIDCYIDKNKISLPVKIDLSGKINAVANDLRAKGLASNADLKNIRRLAQKGSINCLSVSTFHGFVHDYKFSPIPTELKKYWDDLNSFFNLLWKSFLPAAGKKK